MDDVVRKVLTKERDDVSKRLDRVVASIGEKERQLAGERQVEARLRRELKALDEALA